MGKPVLQDKWVLGFSTIQKPFQKLLRNVGLGQICFVLLPSKNVARSLFLLPVVKDNFRSIWSAGDHLGYSIDSFIFSVANDHWNVRKVALLQGIKGVFGQEGRILRVKTEKEAVVDWLPRVWSVAHHLVFVIKKPHLGYQLFERHFLETLNQLRGGSRRVAANGESKGSAIESRMFVRVSKCREDRTRLENCCPE